MRAVLSWGWLKHQNKYENTVKNEGSGELNFSNGNTDEEIRILIAGDGRDEDGGLGGVYGSGRRSYQSKGESATKIPTPHSYAPLEFCHQLSL